jgi:hypothetical protein
MGPMNEIADLLERAVQMLRQASAPEAGAEAAPSPEGEFIACTPKVLPKRLLRDAAATAVSINPANAPMLGPMAALGGAPVDHPLFIAALTSKYWGAEPRTLGVSFMEQTPADLANRILSHMNAWADGTPGCCIRFALSRSQGDVRVSRGPGGYYSYLGTDVLHIPRNQQTMNLERFTMQTLDAEFFRVVRHETGHTLGFPHEHMRASLVAQIDPQKAIAEFGRTQGWDANTVQQQVLTPLEERSLMGTPPDVTSIMCYQLPGKIMRDGKGFPGGNDINDSDRKFAAKLYPKPGGDAGGDAGGDVDWLV